MKYPTIEQFKLDDQYFEEIHPNVWLMDDHKWAYYVWESYCFNNPLKKPLALLHFDYHWDGINDFVSDSAQEMLKKTERIGEIFDLFSNSAFVRKDSFIAPAIIRGIVNEIYFFCFQDNTETGLDEDLLKKYHSKQFIYKNIDLIPYHKIKNYFLDIDLDLFNNSDMWAKSDLWENSDICDFLRKCSGLIKNASLITIAMSFGYSGTYEDTRKLTKKIVPEILKYYKN